MTCILTQCPAGFVGVGVHTHANPRASLEPQWPGWFAGVSAFTGQSTCLS
jgi:hypothetical protein